MKKIIRIEVEQKYLDVLSETELNNLINELLENDFYSKENNSIFNDDEDLLFDGIGNEDIYNENKRIENELDILNNFDFEDIKSFFNTPIQTIKDQKDHKNYDDSILN